MKKLEAQTASNASHPPGKNMANLTRGILQTAPNSPKTGDAGRFCTWGIEFWETRRYAEPAGVPRFFIGCLPARVRGRSPQPAPFLFHHLHDMDFASSKLQSDVSAEALLLEPRVP